MNDKLKLTKIALETKDGKTVELTIDEAKELHEQLHSLFGEKTTYIPSSPIVIERDRWYPPYPPTWYGTGSMTSPQFDGLDVQCRVTGDSGLSVNYCGDVV